MKKKKEFEKYDVPVSLRISKKMEDELIRFNGRRTSGISAICREAIAIFLENNLTKSHIGK